jgi:hypothetical protein
MLYQILQSGFYTADSLGKHWFLAASTERGLTMVADPDHSYHNPVFVRIESEWLLSDSPAWKDICRNGHSYYLIGMVPGRDCYEVQRTGKPNIRWTYEYKCNLCPAKFSSRIEVKFSKHLDCVRGFHLWVRGCTLCCPGNAYCARLCGATPPGYGCRCLDIW